MGIKGELISIIVPVYNTENYLNRCVESILNQTYEQFELILVDDGSTDNSFEVCEKYAKADNRVVVIHKDNGGQSSARNLGIKSAHGNYYAFVDSDDWVAEDFIEKLYSLIKKYDADISVVNYRISYSFPQNILNDEPEKEFVWKKDEAVKYIFEQTNTNVAVWNKLYKREIVTGCQFPEGQFYEEYLFQLNVLKNVNTVASSTAKKYFYFQRDNSTVHLKTPKKEIDNMYSFYSSLPIVREFYPYEEQFCRQSLAEHYYFFSACNKFSSAEKQNNLDFIHHVEDITGIQSDAIKKSKNPFSNIFYTYLYHHDNLRNDEKKALQNDYRMCWKLSKFKKFRTISYFLGYVSLELAAKVKRA